MKKIAIAVIGLFLFSPIAFASDFWWQKGEEGWFWYNEPEVYPEPEPETEPEQLPEPTPPMSLLPLPGEPLATEKMKIYGDKLLSDAVVSPTPDKVKKYVEYQKLMMTMAQEFSETWQIALMQNPELGARTDVKAQMLTAIKELSNSAGLMYFYDSECEGCSYMDKELKDFAMTYPEMAIIPVSIDGYANSLWPNSRLDNGTSLRMGVTQTPTLILAFPREDRFKKITDYPVSSVELEKRIFYYTHEGRKKMKEYREMIFTELGIFAEN